MDVTIAGSIIQAIASLCGNIIVAVIAVAAIFYSVKMAKEQILSSNDQLRTELEASREIARLSSYEYLVSSVNQVFGMMSQDDVTSMGILEHFHMEEIPNSGAERKMLLFAMMQLSLYENLYYRHEKGYFPDELWDQWDRSMANSFQDEPITKVWNESDYKKYFWRKFADYVDRTYFFEERQMGN